MLNPRKIGWRCSTCRLLTVLFLAGPIVACGPRQTPATVAVVGVPDHVNEHISLASDGDSTVALVWAATSESAGTNIHAAVSTDGGVTFSPPVRVNDVERQANVNGEQPPRVALTRGADGIQSIVVLWTARGGGGTALLAARSTDGGRTFGPTTPLPGVDAPGNRGWESMAAGQDGVVYALWLDHRDSAPGAATGEGHGHQHGVAAPGVADGVVRAQRSQLFVSAIDGRLAPAGIARGVCYCCKTALTTGGDGTIYAAWRHVYEGNHRDIAFTMSRDGGRSFQEPVRVSQDGWQLDGCPENGPALGADRANRIHVVWPTLVQRGGSETLTLFYTWSGDGRAFAARTALPASGAAYHPQLAVLPDGSLLVAWDELRGGTRRVRAARGRTSAGGHVEFSPLVLAGGGPAGSYPAVSALADHAVLAWADRSGAASTIAVSRVPY